MNEKAPVASLFEELGKLRSPYRLAVDLWAQADILQVERRRPLHTARGKVLPFRALGPR